MKGSFVFGLFGTATFTDPVLGKLSYGRRRWRGSIQLAGADLPLAMSGDRKSPDERAIEAARQLSAKLDALRPQIESALFEHYKPYADAVASGDLPPPPEGAVEISSPAEAWHHAVAQFVSIEPMGDVLVTELGIAVAWDEEHTLGARFDGSRFIELCGSTVPS